VSIIAKTIRRGRQGSRDQWPTIPFNQWAEYMTLNGLTYGTSPNYSLGRNVERVGSGFQSIVEGAYRANGVVFACCVARMLAFSEARFQFRRMRNGRPGDLFGTGALGPLEEPWPNGTTGDLLSRMIVDADLAGNWFGVLQTISNTQAYIRRLRPDWVVIVLGSRTHTDPNDVPAWQWDVEPIGYVYYPGGMGAASYTAPKEGSPGDFNIFAPDVVSHFAPIPDPMCQFRGQSWIPPVASQIMGHQAATQHKLMYFEQGATPNTVVTVGPEVTDPRKFQEWVDVFDEEHEGLLNAYKTIYLASGSDVRVVGNSLKDLTYHEVQGHDETMISAAARIPPIIVGLSEGLENATYSNFAQARRAFSDFTVRPMWRNAAASLSRIIQVPSGSELWYDERDVAFLREDARDQAEIQVAQSTAMKQGVEAGYEPDSVVEWVSNNDLSRLKHTGLTSSQLKPPVDPNAPPEPAPEPAPAVPASNGKPTLPVGT
jgi:hypothetical protein